MIDYKKQGKKNRASGRVFEMNVRKEMESKGWIVCKWVNNVEFYDLGEKGKCWAAWEGDDKFNILAHIIPAKHKFNPFNRAMVMGTGFPDFICFRINDSVMLNHKSTYDVIGVEVKSNGTLNKEEKSKCKWYLDHKIFSKILIAKKGNKRGKIEYKEFEHE